MNTAAPVTTAPAGDADIMPWCPPHHHRVIPATPTCGRATSAPPARPGCRGAPLSPAVAASGGLLPASQAGRAPRRLVAAQEIRRAAGQCGAGLARNAGWTRNGLGFITNYGK